MSFQNLVQHNNMLDSLRCNNCRSYHVCQPMYQRDLVHIPLDQECIHNTNQNWFLLPSHDQFPPHPIRSQPEILIHAQHELIVTTTCLSTHIAALMTSKVEWLRWLPTRHGISSTFLKRQGKKNGIAQNHVRQMIYTLLNELFHTHLISLISKGLINRILVGRVHHIDYRITLEIDSTIVNGSTKNFAISLNKWCAWKCSHCRRKYQK